MAQNTTRQSVRVRSENIITNAPGVKGTAKLAKTEIETWSLFITDIMLNTVLTYTNIQIKDKREKHPKNKEQYHMKGATFGGFEVIYRFFVYSWSETLK